MTEIKFDPKKLAKLNNPERFKTLSPDVIWDALDMQNPKVLIDIGAGTGFFAKEFVKKLKEGTVYACDSNDEMVQWMQENITDKNIVPSQCSDSFLDLNYDIADLVYMINVHHELSDSESLLKEAYKLLKKGGKIAIIDWKTVEMEDGPPIEFRISGKEIRNQLHEVGFINIFDHNVLPLHSFAVGQK